MARNGFWRMFFSKSKSEKTGLSRKDRELIRKSLETEYGLMIQEDTTPPSNLAESHYRKIAGDELGRLDQLFQYIPQLVTHSINKRSVLKAFKAATENTYRVRLSPGLKLSPSRSTPEAYRAIARNDKIIENAELFSNNATLTVSKAPQVALGIFNLASMITGQYFMSQVNTKLTALSSNVDKLIKMLDAQRHARLKTASQEIRDIIARIEFTMQDEDKTNEEINQIHEIQRTVSTEMNTCHELINNEISEMNPNDNTEKIKSHIESLRKLYIEYQFATQLYGIATLLEVRIRNISDPQELVKYREQIIRRSSQFKEDLAQSDVALNDYLDKTHALNDKSVVEWLTAGTAGAVTTLATGIISAFTHSSNTGYNMIDDFFESRRQKNKEAIVKQVDAYFEPIRNTIALESPASAIDRYIEAVGQEVEFIKEGNDYYTNIPEA